MFRNCHCQLRRNRCSRNRSAAGEDVSFLVGQKRGEDGAAGASTPVTSGPNAAAVAGDDVVGDPEAESVADVLLGGEKGIKDFGERLIGDDGAVIDEADGSTGALAVAPRP